MSSNVPGHRQLLRLLLAVLLTGACLGSGPVWANTESRHARFVADVGILYGLLNLHLDGTLTESIDRTAGTYAVTMAGEGVGIGMRIHSRGLLREGRWTPLAVHSLITVKGRETRSDVMYDWTQGAIEYHFRGETFFLRRLRVADDVVTVPAGIHVDDPVSAMLNYADGSWAAQADGTFQTHVVRRKKPEGEGLDDVRGAYRADLVPVTLTITPDTASGRPTALLDMSPFSPWARPNDPAKVTFGRDRRPELVSLGMILGTTLRVEIRTLELRGIQGSSR